MASDPLLTPFQLKHLTLKNRLMSTAHEPSYSDDGMPKERYRLYHAEKAKGGIAMTMTAGSALVSADSPAAFGNLYAYKDEIVPWMAELTDACHEHGCAVMIQLTHLGRRTNWNHSDWLPVLSASPVREIAHRSFPKQAELWDIERIVDDYADAAERMQKAGLDGIEIEAYGHLLDSFWSPATNHRDDVYGGSLENRLRFLWQVIDSVRQRVGDDFIVGIRMVADEQWDKGLSKEEGVEIARQVARSGKFDFINLIRGHIDSDAALTNVIPVQGMPSAPHLDFAGEVRQSTQFPIFHAAKISDVATARHAVAEGKLDMVGMTRAHLADPHIIRKIEAGIEYRIRPCVGATYCLDRIYEDGEALCIHNAATGREASIPHEISPSARPVQCVVVGAGPAGLEAARVAAERGHKVTLLEASGLAGGQVQLLVRNERRRDMIGIVDWRVQELQRLGVDIQYNVLAEKSDVEALNPQVVVIATGGIAQNPAIEEGEQLLTSSWDIVAGDEQPAESVLLYDDSGSHAGMTAAEIIANKGVQLELVSPERFLSPDMGGLNFVPYMKAMHDNRVKITPATRLHSVAREGNQLRVTFCSDYSPAWRDTRLVDQVVVEHATSPNEELYFALKPEARNAGQVNYENLISSGEIMPVCNEDGRYVMYRIGDAVASRNIHAAIYDAVRMGLRW
ncbi:MAG: FAD-dependent oxidoreductase [Granulosicoccus sp.]